MQATRSKLQREPGTGHAMDAISHLLAGHQVRETSERLRSTNTSADEKLDGPATANCEYSKRKFVQRNVVSTTYKLKRLPRKSSKSAFLRF